MELMHRRRALRRLAGAVLPTLAGTAAARALAQPPERFAQRPVTLWVP